MEIGRRGRGRAIQRVANAGLREEIRILSVRLAAVEAGRHRDPEGGDDSEEEFAARTDGSNEEGLEIKLLSEDKKVKFAATKLKGQWDNVQTERRRSNKPQIKKWNRMIAKMKSKFLPKDYQIALYRQVQNLKQRAMTMKEYTKEFYKVNMRAGYVEDTPEKTARFVNELRMEKLDEISILSPKSIKEAYHSDLKEEEEITRKQNARRRRGSGRGRGQSFGKGKTANSNEEGNSSKTARPTDKEGQRGAYVSQPEEAKAPPQEVENMHEIGEALVLNKVLLKPAKELADQTQWKALFRTMCKSHGKCCKLIIDSRSTDNLVAIEMVEKLGLKRLKHPTPYQMSWLQKGHQLLVDEQCEVEFHIGRYKDKVTCDIMPMGVCHILLGRTWQYNRKVVHYGKTNCYKFVKYGIKHTLVPMKEEDKTENSGTKVLLLGGKEFLQQIGDDEIKFAIVQRPRAMLIHTEITYFPEEIQDMLQEFSDIVVDDLPDKLPPRRSISHHIDFIPGAILPNKVAY
eukprot:PITA_16833